METPSKSSPIDDQAFMEQLFATYQRLIYAVAKRTCDDPNLWGDIVQESVLRLCRYVEQLRPLTERALAMYISVTVRYTAADLVREAVAQREDAERSMLDRGLTTA